MVKKLVWCKLINADQVLETLTLYSHCKNFYGDKSWGISICDSNFRGICHFLQLHLLLVLWLTESEMSHHRSPASTSLRNTGTMNSGRAVLLWPLLLPLAFRGVSWAWHQHTTFPAHVLCVHRVQCFPNISYQGFTVKCLHNLSIQSVSRDTTVQLSSSFRCCSSVTCSLVASVRAHLTELFPLSYWPCPVAFNYSIGDGGKRVIPMWQLQPQWGDCHPTAEF